MLRTRRLICLLALIFALPSAAFAQGAGDDQYQDPFGGGQTTPSQGGQGEDDGGLSPEPPSGGGNGGGGNGGGDSGGGDSGGGGTDEAPDGGAEGAAPEAEDQLPNTGSEPLTFAVLGASLLLLGAGLRLRTIDPDRF